MLGDFNARVGLRVYLDDQWTGVRGIGDLNDASRITFILGSHVGTVCNAWLERYL